MAATQAGPPVSAKHLHADRSARHSHAAALLPPATQGNGDMGAFDGCSVQVSKSRPLARLHDANSRPYLLRRDRATVFVGIEFCSFFYWAPVRGE